MDFTGHGHQDLAGNALTGDMYKDFMTGDFTVPTIVSTAPTDGATNVSTATGTYVVEFSEPMDNASVEDAFAISPSVPGTFDWDARHTVLTFDPIGLAYSTEYTVSLGTGAMDQHGLALAQAHSWNFTTRPRPTGAIMAMVVGEDGYTISGVTVSIGGISTTTNKTGHFVLEAVPAGERKLVVNHPDYESKSVSVRVVADQTTSVDDIILAPKTEHPLIDWVWIPLIMLIIVLAVVLKTIPAFNRKLNRMLNRRLKRKMRK